MGLLDWIIIAIMGFLAFRGFRRGFVVQLLDVLGAIVALIAAFRWFEPLGGLISRLLGCSPTLGSILAFILIAVSFSGIVSLCGLIWRRKTKTNPVSFVDSLGGAVFGALKGVLIVGFLLVIIGTIPVPSVHAWVGESGLAHDIGQVTPKLYGILERSLPANVPRLLITPEGPQLRRTRLSDLDGATCVDCRGKARFEGFESRGLLYSPRFVCTKCGRTSDGCQTYEGFHQIYGRCAVEAAIEGVPIDCESWPNNRPVYARGPCPTCGKQAAAAKSRP